MMPADMLSEVEQVKSIVARYFPIYDVRVNYSALTIFISPDKTTLESNFDKMRIEMNEKQYIPFLQNKGGEYTLTIVKKDSRRTKGIWINISLLAVTILTTILAGAALWAGYKGYDDWITGENLLWGGMTFALPLMVILGVHELSHYFMAKKHNVAASLPFFIPSIPPLGTMGAFISMRDPIPNRKALIDIGIAGPIGGLIVTVPIAILGLVLTADGTAVSGEVTDGGSMQVFFQLFYSFLMLFVPLPDNVNMHPVMFAAWVGFFVTAINLLPAGQLDGGHVARGFLGDNAKYLSYITVVLLFFLGFFYYSGWLLFALLVFLLGLKHPQPLDDISGIDTKRKMLGALAILILLVTFVPIPISTVAPDYSFDTHVDGSNEVTVAAGSSVVFYMEVENTGNTKYDVEMEMKNILMSWNGGIYLTGGNATSATDYLKFSMVYEGNSTVVLALEIPSDQASGVQEIIVEMTSIDPDGETQESSTQSFFVTVS